MPPVAVSFDSVVLWLHVSAVVVGFGSLFSYPVFLAALRHADPAQRVFFHTAQGRVGRYLVSPSLLVIVLAGAYLATERELWAKLWVSVPLLIALILGGLGGAWLAPRERRLSELARAGDESAYAALLGRVAGVTYVALALVLVAAFLMITKPGG